MLSLNNSSWISAGSAVDETKEEKLQDLMLAHVQGMCRSDEFQSQGSGNIMSGCRPAALTSHMIKTMEKLVY